MAGAPKIGNIAFVGGHVPRRCGIATFTSDVCRAVAEEFPAVNCRVVAMTDPGREYDYPSPVEYAIRQEERAAYAQAAEYLELRGVEVISVQHEFGIFGGSSGSHLLDLLDGVSMPVVATLHTVLREPSDEQRHVMERMKRLCDRFVVMAEHGREMLGEVYGIAMDRVDVVPHGVIDVPFLDPEYNKDRFDVLGKRVLLTFGLLSPNKGLENAIRALPEVVERHPNVVYVIAGVTHPHLVAEQGEVYREGLLQLAEELGVAGHLRMINRFMDLAELMALIEASDIYLTPYLNEAQITSGALSYAFGAGKAIVSTPYWHAQELLADGRGQLVPFADPGAMAEAVNRYLDDGCWMTSVRKRAYATGRSMIWPMAARAYMESFERAREQRSRGLVDRVVKRAADRMRAPKPNMSHLIRLTGPLGIFQHAVHNVAAYGEGCCLDDNARAYQLSVLLEESGVEVEGKEAYMKLAERYLAFLWDAFDSGRGRFRNFMNRSQEWTELEGSDDSHGRAVWAAGVGVAGAKDAGHRKVCAMLFHRGVGALRQMRSPRAWAFGLLGIDAYLRACPGDRLIGDLRKDLVAHLTKLYSGCADEGWRWFESVVSYDNARMSQAMIQSGLSMGCEATVAIGLESLKWLVEIQTSEGGWLTPVGCHGFWRKGEPRARFDQQPLEAAAMVSACLQAERVEADGYWKRQADFCLGWFTGFNDLGLPLDDPESGGCHDGLRADHCNANWGAESGIVFQTALVEMMLERQTHEKGESNAQDQHTEHGHRTVTG